MQMMCLPPLWFWQLPEEKYPYCVPKKPDSFEVRVPLAPKEEMEGCTFCHAARFLAAFDTKEHALAAARKLASEKGGTGSW